MKLLTNNYTVIVAYTGLAPDWALADLAKVGTDGYSLQDVAYSEYLEGDDIRDWDTTTGTRIVPRVIVEPVLTQEQQITNEIAELVAYMDQTDWYTSRKSETGAAIPGDVVTKRAETRERISALREMKVELEEHD